MIFWKNEKFFKKLDFPRFLDFSRFRKSKENQWKSRFSEISKNPENLENSNFLKKFSFFSENHHNFLIFLSISKILIF